MTEIAYKPLSVAEQVFHDVVWRPFIITGELALEGYVPFFALPGVKQIEEGVIDEVTEWAFHQFVLVVDLGAIRLVNTLAQSAYDSASVKLKVILLDYGTDSPQYANAKEEAKRALAKFVSYGSQ